MQQPFPDNYKEIANSMGISLYQRFSSNEASLFLRCQLSDVEKLQKNGKIGFVQVTKTETMFFGYQLLEHLLKNTVLQTASPQKIPDAPERILRIKEVTELTGISRTTIWRMERNGKFPARVQLGVGSVGWKSSSLQKWMAKRQEAI